MNIGQYLASLPRNDEVKPLPQAPSTEVIKLFEFLESVKAKIRIAFGGKAS